MFCSFKEKLEQQRLKSLNVFPLPFVNLSRFQKINYIPANLMTGVECQISNTLFEYIPEWDCTECIHEMFKPSLVSKLSHYT